MYKDSNSGLTPEAILGRNYRDTDMDAYYREFSKIMDCLSVCFLSLEVFERLDNHLAVGLCVFGIGDELLNLGLVFLNPVTIGGQRRLLLFSGP